jgi:hypothetical protein
MRRWVGSFGVAWFLSCILLRSTTFASFTIISDSVKIDDADRTTSFSLQFDFHPNFTATDHLGRQIDSFQYFIDPNTSGNPLSPTAGDTIIRGEEIHAADALRIRNATGDHSGPSAGGWGAIRGTVPFTVSDDSVQFTVGWHVLGETGDHFKYAVQTYEFGSLNDSRVRLIPLPSALWAGGSMLAIVIVAQILLSKHWPT